MVLHGVHASLIYVCRVRARNGALSAATVQMSAGWIYTAGQRILFRMCNRWPRIMLWCACCSVPFIYTAEVRSGSVHRQSYIITVSAPDSRYMLGSLIIQTSEAGWWQLPPPELSRVSRGVGSNDGVFQGPRDMPRRSDRSTARRGMSSRYRGIQLRALQPRL